MKAGYYGEGLDHAEMFTLNEASVSLVTRIGDSGDDRSVTTAPTIRNLAPVPAAPTVVTTANKANPYVKQPIAPITQPSSPNDTTATTTATSTPTNVIASKPAPAPVQSSPAIAEADPESIGSNTYNSGSIRGGVAPRRSIDSASVVSDLTQSVATDASSSVRRFGLRSVFGNHNNGNVVDGRTLLNEGMMIHSPEGSLSAKDATRILDSSAQKPGILLGYQVS